MLFGIVNFQSNPNLTCLKVDKIPVPSNWVKDATASYQTDSDCN